MNRSTAAWFCVNIDVVKRVVPALIETGKYDYPYLISSLNEISSEQLQLKLTKAWGLTPAWSPAARQIKPV